MCFLKSIKLHRKGTTYKVKEILWVSKEILPDLCNPLNKIDFFMVHLSTIYTVQRNWKTLATGNWNWSFYYFYSSDNTHLPYRWAAVFTKKKKKFFDKPVIYCFPRKRLTKLATSWWTQWSDRQLKRNKYLAGVAGEQNKA